MAVIKLHSNAVDWFREEYCKHCDRACLYFSKEMVTCILANILFELQAFFGDFKKPETEETVKKLRKALELMESEEKKTENKE